MMDPSSMFRGRLRKRGCEGVTKKGPLVAKHPSPPAPSPSSSTTSTAPPCHSPPSPQATPPPPPREVRSSGGMGAPLRRRGSSPDPRTVRLPTTTLAASPTSPNYQGVCTGACSPVGSPAGSPKCSPVRREDASVCRTPSTRSGTPAHSRPRPRPLSPSPTSHHHRPTPPTSPKAVRTSNRPSSPITSSGRSPPTPSVLTSARVMPKARPQPSLSHSPVTPTDGGFHGVGSDSPLSSGIPRRIPLSSHQRGISPTVTGGAVGSTSIPVARGHVGASSRDTRGGGVLYRGTSSSRGTSPSNPTGGPTCYRGTSPGSNNYRGFSPTGPHARRPSPGGGGSPPGGCPPHHPGASHTAASRGISPSGLPVGSHRGMTPNGGGGASNIRGNSPSDPNFRGTSPNGGTNFRGTSPNGGNLRGTSPNGSSNFRGTSPNGGGSFRGTSPGSRGSSSSSAAGGLSEEVIRGRVRRAVRARLYLLHQPGPNSFSVGGDSPTHKYKVIIGPQSCSCGHGPACVHVLFVMVRVLQLPDNSPLLMASALKDYEVEQLLGAWEERRKKAVRARGGATALAPTSASAPAPASSSAGLSHSGGNRAGGGSAGRVTPTGTSPSRGAATGGHDDSGDDESQCPICLTVMVEGESLVACESGCRNLLHHHCMAVWAADRHSQMLPLLCPLCRAPWPAKTNPRLLVAGEADSCSSGPGPPHTAAASNNNNPLLLLRNGECSPGMASAGPTSNAPMRTGAALEGFGTPFCRGAIGDGSIAPGGATNRYGVEGGGMNESGYGSVVGLGALTSSASPFVAESHNVNSIYNNSGSNSNINGSGGRDVRSISSVTNGHHQVSGRGPHGGEVNSTHFPVYSKNYNGNHVNAFSSSNFGGGIYAGNQQHAGTPAAPANSSRPSLSSRHLSQQQQHLQQQQQPHHQYHLSSNNRAPQQQGSGCAAAAAGGSDRQPSKSVPMIRAAVTPTSGRLRGTGDPPGMSASFSGSGSSGGRPSFSSNRPFMSHSQSHPNTSIASPTSTLNYAAQSRRAASAYSSPLLPNYGMVASSLRNSKVPNPLSRNPGGGNGFSGGGGSSGGISNSRRSSSNTRIPSSVGGHTPVSPSGNVQSGSGGATGLRYHHHNNHVIITNHHNHPFPSPSHYHTPLGMPPHVGCGVLPNGGYYPPTLHGEVSAAMVADVGDDEVPLPRSEPIPAEQESTAAAWVAEFGRDLVACLFSKDWAVRETGLRRLAHEVKVLHWDQLVTGVEKQKKMVHCCANILAQVVNDPVYKVYLACLRVVRVLLAHLTLTVPGEVYWLQELLRPLLHTLLLKCADGNRRTSQISVDSLLELSRGQEGELALGGGHGLSLGGVQYVLSCILDEPPPKEAPWQWLLGRLCVLDRLLDQFPEQFQIQVVSLQPLESGYKLQHYDRLMTVVEFAFKALGSSHSTVAKLARRVYICGARMAAAEPSVFRHVCDMLSKLDSSLQTRLKRRLRSLQGQNCRPSLNRLTDHPINHKPRSQIEASLRPYISTALPRLVRSVSHSPSRLLSATKSLSPSVVKDDQQQQKSPQVQQPQQTQESNCEDPDRTSSPVTAAANNNSSNSNDANSEENKGCTDTDSANVEQPAVRQSPPRPTHLPLDSLHMKLMDKQARVTQYHKSRPRQEEPIIVQHALITPKAQRGGNNSNNNNQTSSSSTSSNKHSNTNKSFKASEVTRKSSVPQLRKGGLSQSHGNNLDMSPRTPIGPPLPSFTFKEAVASPTSPNAPFTTPVQEVTHPILSAKLQSDIDSLAFRNEGVHYDSNLRLEPPLPKIPSLSLLPPYLEQDVGSSQERIAEESQCLYEEGNEWQRGPLLGSGAFSCCYQARDVATGVLMAVKLVSFVRNSSEEQERVEAAVEDEILLMSQLRHRNIVRLMGSVRHATSFCVFTEWMAGGSVSAMLEKYGSFSENVVLRYVKQILHGLDYLHDNMILHRDLKGANLLIDSTGDWLRIGDFGTAARLASKATVTGEFQGQLLGTIAFMAPEVLRGDDYGRACDIWSVGCCIIEMATTKPPWDADHVSNQYKLMFKIATSNGPPIVPEQLSEQTRAVTLHCLQTVSEDRPTAKQLLNNPLFVNVVLPRF